MSAAFWFGRKLRKASVDLGSSGAGSGESSEGNSASGNGSARTRRKKKSKVSGPIGSRRLCFDSLEERALLSVTPSTLSAILVNQTFGSSVVTNTAHSSAVDSSGDFVVTWTSADTVTNPSATSITFAPTAAATQPITGTFKLVVGGVTTASITFNSTSAATLRTTATNIQTALSNAGQPFATVTYNQSFTSTSYNFTINYGTGNTAPSLSYVASTVTPLPIYFNSAAAPIINPSTGAPYTQSNVYARYFTPEVQQLTLPTAATINSDNNANTVGRFSLEYNAETQMELAVTAATAPAGDANAPTDSNILGSFTLWYDANGNGTVDTGETLQVNYDETSPTAAATQIQNWLRSFTPVTNVSNAQTVTVNAIDPQHLMIDFGAATQGLDQSNLLQYLTPANGGTTAFTGGYLPAVSITTLDRPFAITNIPISQTDPEQTAQAIESWFEQPGGAYSTGVAPFSFPTPERIGDAEAPYTAPIYSTVSSTPGVSATNAPQTGFNPSVSVVPVSNPDGSLSLTEFDITFTGNSGYQIEPQLVVTSVTTETGTVIPTSQASAKILKETSPQFQVNPVTPPTSIFSQTPIIYNSDQPAVAMDASGDFAITWREEVSQQLAPKDGTDIYMRMYTPVGIANSFDPGLYVPGQVVTGVRLIPSPVISQQQQLTFTYSGSTTFGLTIDSNTTGLPITTGSIAYNSGNPTATAANIQAALITAGFKGVTVTYNTPSNTSITPTSWSYTVTFGGASEGINEDPIQLTSGSLLPSSAFSQSLITTDMYTQTVNIDATTNPQYDPAIAMDPQGNIVVVWASQGPDVSYFNDIYMQRFDKDGNLIGGPVLVNTEKTDIETQPAVAIGSDDNVVVSWTEITTPAYLVSGAAEGTILVRAFDKNSNAFWPQQVVTNTGSQSAVAMDSEDNFIVTWTGGPDTDPTGSTSEGVYGTEYALSGGVQSLTFATGATTDTSLNVSGTFSLQLGTVTTQQIQFIGNDPTTTASNIQAALDAIGYTGVLVSGVTQGNPNSNNLPEDVFTISFQQLAGGSNAPTIQYISSFSAVPLNVSTQTVSVGTTGPTTVRPEFRVNSAYNGTSSVTTWPLDQNNTAVAISSSGDIAAVYQGGGPEVSQNIDISGSFFTQYFENLDTGAAINSDLLPYFDPFTSGAYLGVVNGKLGPYQSKILDQTDNVTWQVAIDQVLYLAANPTTGSGITAATTEQLGRLRQILDNVAGLLDGESAGVLMTQIDANPQNSQPTAPLATYSDNIVNTQRSGQDQRYYIILGPDEEQGTFQLTLSLASDAQPDTTMSGTATSQTVTVTVPQLGGDAVPYGGPDVNATQTNIWTAITGVLGNIYPGTGTTGESVDVRQVPISEIDARNGTAWQLPMPVNDAQYDAADAQAPRQSTLAQPTPDYGYTVYEVTFQGDVANLPVTMTVSNSTMEFWEATQVSTNGVITTTPVLVGASAPVAAVGDYSGTQGAESYNPSVSMTPEGDIISSYTTQALQTNGVVPTNSTGTAIYQNIYVEPLAESTNIAGPQLVGWNDGTGADLLAGSETGGGTVTNVGGKYFILTFDTPMLAGNPVTSPDSVLNTLNYKLYNSNGVQITGGISLAQYGLSEVAQLAQSDPGAGFDAIPSNKWEVVLTIGNGGITNGTYTLQVDHAESATSTTAGQTGLENIYGTSMYVSGYDPTGHDFLGTVTISNSSSAAGNPGTPGTNTNDTPVDASQSSSQTNPSVAAAANGTYVMVWTSTTNGISTIVGQRFKANGTVLGPEFTVNTSFYGSYADPEVSMDPNGDFVVVWDGPGPDYNAITNPTDVFARIFSSTGQAEGGQFQVDYYESGAQTQPRVAMAPNGNFVVTFTSYVQNVVNNQASGGATLIFAREFALGGSALVNSLQPNGYEFQVSNTTVTANSQYSDVAIDSAGDFVITWEGDYQNSSNWGVFGRYYYANLTSSGVVQLNTKTGSRGSFVNTTEIQATGPRVGMDGSGNFVVTWANYTNTTAGYDVYARRFGKGIVALDPSEFMVNQYTAGWQLMPDIGVDASGNFTVVWTSYQPEPLYPTVFTYDIEARMYNANGTDFYDQALGTYPMEYRVNATVVGDQVAPAVSRGDTAGDSFIAWAGPASSTNTLSAIFARVVDPPPPSSNPGSTVTTTAATTAKATTTTSSSTSGSSTPPASNVPVTVTTTAPKTTTVTAPATVATLTTVAISKVATTTTTAKPATTVGTTTTVSTTLPTTVAKTTTTTVAATTVPKTTTTTTPATTVSTTAPKTTTTPTATTTTATTTVPKTTTVAAPTTVAKVTTPVTTTTTTTTKTTVATPTTTTVPAVSPKPPTVATTTVKTVSLSPLAVNKVLKL